MRKSPLVWVLLLCFCTNVLSQTNHALIIAIGNYPKPAINFWKVIHVERDVPIIQSTLMEHGFKQQNIRILKDAEATKEAIDKSLLELIGRVKEGDRVVIHVSSHGVQIEDDDLDEEIDLLDESIVPYGAMYSYDTALFKKYADQYYRDDDFGNRVVELRNKIGRGGDVLVLLDACYSSTGIRDANVNSIRGGLPALRSGNFERRGKGLQKDTSVFKDGDNILLTSNAATYACISGARAHERNNETNIEGQWFGSLSYAFGKAMAQLKGDVTYRNLFSMIENIMRITATKQQPVLEGDGIDRILFGGQYVKQKPFIQIDGKASRNDTVILMEGKLAGITKNSEIGFFGIETIDPNGKTPLFTGTVADASYFTSKVKVNTEVNTNQLTGLKGYITKLMYGNQKVLLDIRNRDSSQVSISEKSQFINALKGFELVELNPEYDLVLMPASSGNSWKLYQRGSGNEFDTASIRISDSTGINNLKELIKRFDRARYLRGLNITDPTLNAKVELVFLNKGVIDSTKMNKRLINGSLELKVGDTVFVKIVNMGLKTVYYNILDIQPDGKINRILPNSRLKKADGNLDPILSENCFVKPNDSLVVTQLRIKISPPLGAEVFKVFLADKQFNLEDKLATEPDSPTQNTKGIFDNLERIFIKSKVDKAGKRSITVVPSGGAMFNINFIITQ